ncbi:hypothetical protein BDZ88DRAFT_455258 [Geranomyces variabilis]|nr:hypothetical protein BDZ88DRAFT_455258 [Geranomyces variabilis]KAJ3131919.1 hypothetical protein HDU90_007666 [Geranomyces variabilis]
MGVRRSSRLAGRPAPSPVATNPTAQTPEKTALLRQARNLERDIARSAYEICYHLNWLPDELFLQDTAVQHIAAMVVAERLLVPRDKESYDCVSRMPADLAGGRKADVATDSRPAASLPNSSSFKTFCNAPPLLGAPEPSGATSHVNSRPIYLPSDSDSAGRAPFSRKKRLRRYCVPSDSDSEDCISFPSKPNLRSKRRPPQLTAPSFTSHAAKNKIEPIRIRSTSPSLDSGSSDSDSNSESSYVNSPSLASSSLPSITSSRKPIKSSVKSRTKTRSSRSHVSDSTGGLRSALRLRKRQATEWASRQCEVRPKRRYAKKSSNTPTSARLHVPSAAALRLERTPARSATPTKFTRYRDTPWLQVGETIFLRPPSSTNTSSSHHGYDLAICAAATCDRDWFAPIYVRMMKHRCRNHNGATYFLPSDAPVCKRSVADTMDDLVENERRILKVQWDDGDVRLEMHGKSYFVDSELDAAYLKIAQANWADRKY